jgi:hypothetical protein
VRRPPPELSLNKKQRLRGSAVSLSREAHKARRKLDQLQRARLTASPQPEVPAPAPPDKPGTDQPTGLIESAREAPETSTRSGDVQGWTQGGTMSRQQRRAAERIARNLKRDDAERARREAAKAPVPAAGVSRQPAMAH